MIKRCSVCKRMFLLQDEVPPAGKRIEHKGCPGAASGTKKEVGGP